MLLVAPLNPALLDPSTRGTARLQVPVLSLRTPWTALTLVATPFYRLVLLTRSRILPRMKRRLKLTDRRTRQENLAKETLVLRWSVMILPSSTTPMSNNPLQLWRKLRRSTRSS